MSRRVKIVHVVETLEPGGTQRTLATVARGMPAHEFEQAVVARRPGVVSDELRDAGIEVVVTGSGAAASAAATVRAARAVRRRRADVVHLWDDWSLESVGPWFAAGRRSALVCSVRNPPATTSSLARMMRRFVLRRATVVAADRFVRERVAAAYRLSARWVEDCRVLDDIAVEPAGADERDLADEFGLPSETKLIGTACRITAAKNVRDLIFAGALLRLAREDFRLVIIGDGPELPAVRRFCTLMRMDDLTLFVAPVADARSIIGRCAVYVDCAVSDGPSRGIAEAQASGVPVVCVDTPPRRTQVEDGADGLLFAPRDPGSLTRRLYELLGDDGVRERLAVGARGRASRLKPAEAVVEEYEGIYRSLA